MDSQYFIIKSFRKLNIPPSFNSPGRQPNSKNSPSTTTSSSLPRVTKGNQKFTYNFIN